MLSLRDLPFSPYREIELFQAGRLSEMAGKFGAAATFVGNMRDFNEGDRVSEMFLEHYPGMTERCLEKIIEEAGRRWSFLEALVIHRVGKIEPGETIVLVAIWSTHRGSAFDACRYIMEELKSRAPFWKKETLPDLERWVAHNTNGY